MYNCIFKYSQKKEIEIKEYPDEADKFNKMFDECFERNIQLASFIIRVINTYNENFLNYNLMNTIISNTNFSNIYYYCDSDFFTYGRYCRVEDYCLFYSFKCESSNTHESNLLSILLLQDKRIAVACADNTISIYEPNEFCP